MTTSRHRQARTLLFAAACASIVACNSADIANFNSPNTSQLEGSPNAATVNTTVAGVLAGSRSGAGTWASTLGIFGRRGHGKSTLPENRPGPRMTFGQSVRPTLDVFVIS